MRWVSKSYLVVELLFGGKQASFILPLSSLPCLIYLLSICIPRFPFTLPFVSFYGMPDVLHLHLRGTYQGEYWSFSQIVAWEGGRHVAAELIAVPSCRRHQREGKGKLRSKSVFIVRTSG